MTKRKITAGQARNKSKDQPHRKAFTFGCMTIHAIKETRTANTLGRYQMGGPQILFMQMRENECKIDRRINSEINQTQRTKLKGMKFRTLIQQQFKEITHH